MTDMFARSYVETKFVNLSTFRTHASKILPRVDFVPERVVVVKHGKPLCAVVSMRDYEMIKMFDAKDLGQLRQEFEEIAGRFDIAQLHGYETKPTIRSLG